MLQYKPFELEVAEIIKLILPLDNDTDDIFALRPVLFIHHILFIEPYKLS